MNVERGVSGTDTEEKNIIGKNIYDKIKNPIFINTTKLISKDFASSIEKYLPYLELSCKENINLETEISKFENKIEKQNK